jgi:hypothetical protein
LFEPLKNLQLKMIELRVLGFSEVSFISELATFLCYFLFLPEKVYCPEISIQTTCNLWKQRTKIKIRGAHNETTHYPLG